MSLWSELHASPRLATLTGTYRPPALPRCEFCGWIVTDLEEHQSARRCAPLAAYGLVYFIQAGRTGPIKIGFTRRPIDRRFAQIRPTTHLGLRLLLTVAGTQQNETAQHRAWRRWRLQGEWFRADPAVLEGIAAARARPEIGPNKRKYRVDHLDRMPFAPIILPEDAA